MMTIPVTAAEEQIVWQLQPTVLAAVVAALIKNSAGAITSEILREDLTAAATRGNVTAAILLASYLESLPEAENFLEPILKCRLLAAHHGHGVSLTELVRLSVRRGFAGDESGYERTREFLRKLRGQGSAEAAFYLGFCLEHGLGGAADPRRAWGYYQEAAAGGAEPAQWLVALLSAATGAGRNDLVEAQRQCEALERKLPTCRHGDYQAWPPLFEYITDVAAIYDAMSDQASRDCYLRELLWSLVREAAGRRTDAGAAILKAGEPMLLPLDRAQWLTALQRVHARQTELPTLMYQGAPLTWEKCECWYASTFELEQYRYGDECRIQPGETVFCCGACLGDSALWSAQYAGPQGKVYAFEPMPEVYADLQANLTLNHAGNVEAVPLGVSDQVGKRRFNFMRLGASHSSENGDCEVAMTTIDQFCRERGLTPDFIKMDLEGEELAACRGARETIITHKPRLGVCLYHQPFRDLREIPKLLKSWRPDYRFYLKKSAIIGELVLLAV